MAISLPSRPNLKHLRHEAKAIVRAHRAGALSACPTLRHLRRFAHASDQQILSQRVTLQECQYALALKYGFASWNQIREYVRDQAGQDIREASLVDPSSLSATVDAVNDAEFWQRPLSSSQKRELAEFIAGRQGLPGSYGKLFAPTTKDAAAGFRLYTGERIDPGVGARHILGEEAFRALLLLGIQTHNVQAATTAAWQPFPGWLKGSLAGNHPGMFCCMKCSCAMWRLLAARRDVQHETFLDTGMKALRKYRDGQGGWKYWPFHYTLLTLSEMTIPSAREELLYSATACEQALSRRWSKANPYSRRRRIVMERAIEKANTGVGRERTQA
jgi:hypothetical protein